MSRIDMSISAQKIRKDRFAKCQAIAERIRKRIVNSRPQWQTSQQVASSLKCLLSFASDWSELRESYIAYGNCVYYVATNIKDSIDAKSPEYELRRKSSGGWGRGRSSEGERTMRAKSLISKCPSPFELAYMRDGITQLERLADELDQLYRDYQHWAKHEGTLPCWTTIKKVCPWAGRDAYSVLLAARTGKLSANLAGQHQLFGWHSGKLDEIISSIAIVKERICGRVVAKKGSAPSIKRGRHLLSCAWATNRPQKATHEKARTERVVACEFSRRMQSRIIMGSRCHIPSMLIAAFRHWSKIGTRMVEKLGVERMSPATLVTGRPSKVEGSETDYICPAMWYSERSYLDDDRGIQCSGGLVSGHILMRRGWDDCYHADSSHDLTPSRIAATLTAASDYHFRAIERRRLESLSQLERDKLEKQRLAKVLVTLRRIPELRLSDSYAAGNCVPGTRQFCHVLGIPASETESVNGKTLASKWRKAKWVEKDRLIPVIERMAGVQLS